MLAVLRTALFVCKQRSSGIMQYVDVHDLVNSVEDILIFNQDFTGAIGDSSTSETATVMLPGAAS